MTLAGSLDRGEQFPHIPGRVEHQAQPGPGERERGPCGEVDVPGRAQVLVRVAGRVGELGAVRGPHELARERLERVIELAAHMLERGIHRPAGGCGTPSLSGSCRYGPRAALLSEARERDRALDVRPHRRVTVRRGERAIDGAVEVVHRPKHKGV